MQVKWHHSLRAKLFIFLSFLLVATISILSFRDSLEFKRILEDQLSGRILDTTRRSQNSIVSTLHFWKAQLNQILIRTGISSATEIKKEIQTVIETNPDVIALKLVNVNQTGRVRTLGWSFTNQQNSDTFAEYEASEVNKRFHKLVSKFVKDNPSPTLPNYLLNTSKDLKVPTISLVIPAKNADRSLSWIFLVAKLEPIVASLTGDQSSKAYVVSKQGSVIASLQRSEALRGVSLVNSPIVKKATQGKALRGEMRFTGPDGTTRLGAFAWNKEFKFATIIEKNPEAAFLQINKHLAKNSLIAAIIALIAILAIYHASGTLTASLQKVAQATARIAYGYFSHRIHHRGKDEVAHLSRSVDLMAQKLNELVFSRIEAARQEKELETARTVQNTFFPKDFVKTKTLQIAGSYKPASECGGDWWGYFEANDGSEFLCIADATGHGAPAALITAMAYSAIMTTELLAQQFGNNLTPEIILEQANKVMWAAGQGKTTMTFFVLKFVPETDELVYANAGHNHIILIPEDPADPRAKRKTPIPYINLIARGTPLGVEKNSRYRTHSMPLKWGDRFFLYTDGLTEAVNRKNKQWGNVKMLKSLKTNNNDDIVTMNQQIVQESLHFTEGVPLDDDVTVVIADYKKAAKIDGIKKAG